MSGVHLRAVDLVLGLLEKVLDKNKKKKKKMMMMQTTTVYAFEIM